MNVDTKKLLEQVLKLPPEARAALAGSILDSIDVEVDADREEAWEREIEKRLEEIDLGRTVLVPWSEARRRIAGG